MKRVCILSAVNIKHMSLISLYTEWLKRHGISFDIIYMDKYGIDEAFSAKNNYVFTNIINHSHHPLRKVLQYFKFRRYAVPILEQNKYDFIIVWNDVAIFMFADYLARRWKNKYCLNIRDYCYEEYIPVYWRFRRAIKNSAFATISSEAFRKFLPAHEYIHVHSLNTEVLESLPPRKSLQQIGSPIRISFIGSVRYFEMNQALLEVFRNDDRFRLQYFGVNARRLELYATEAGIYNVSFHDSFAVSETAKFIAETDLVNNLYGSGRVGLDYALAIKLYYGVHNRTPILATYGTHTAEIVNKYGLGFVVKYIEDSLPDKIYQWYIQFDFHTFSLNCERFLAKVEHDNALFDEKLHRYIVDPD